MNIRDAGWITVDLKAWNAFTTIFYDILGVTFEPVVINDALTSTIFLDYDRDKAAYVHSPAYDALSRLCDEMRQFRNLNTNENFAFLGETSPRALGRKTGKIDLPAEKVGMLYGLAHRWINIVNLAEALILHLEGCSFTTPELLPFSPITGLEEAIQAERVTAAELRSVLGI